MVTDEYSCPVDDCGAAFPTGRALGGHAKTHNLRVIDYAALGPAPKCFDSEASWLFAARQLCIEFPGHQITRDFVLSQSCAVCPLMYQQKETSLGLCEPPDGAWTPERRAAKGVDDMTDNPLVVL